MSRERKRGVHRRKRERRPLPGMLLHIDGSRHHWFQDDLWYDLLVILDDATSRIYYAQLVEEESTMTVLGALRKVVEQEGVFCALYSDRASHFFWYNPAMFSIAPQTLSPAAEQASCAPGTAPCNFIGQLGNSGRDILSGPPFRNWDFSLVKDTKVGFLGEAGSIQFRAEFFDVLNHPNFALPNGLVFSGNSGDLTPFSEKPRGTAGSITKTIVPSGGTGARNIQFALRLEF